MVPVLFGLFPFLSLLGAPLLLDERVMFFEARKFIALDPLAPWQLPLGGSGTWRPLLTYVYWLDAGAPSWLSHALNLSLHALLVWLSWRWLCCRLPRGPATIAASLFACHAAHVATAGWVAGRADLLMTLFVVAALLAWEARRGVPCVLAAAAAVLCKETGVVVLPMLALLAVAGGELPRNYLRRLLGVACAVIPLFVLSASIASKGVEGVGQLDPSYWPSAFQPTALLLLPAFAVELVAPLFRPIGIGHGWRDLVGCLLAVPVLTVFVVVGRSSPRRNTWLLGLGLAALALIPVLHVLRNDGGQWYLLLATLGTSLSWGALARDGLPRRRFWLALVLLFALFCAWESSRWRVASEKVDAMVTAALRTQAELGRDAVEHPPPQDPRSWPHMGPSFCCKELPFQVLEGSPGR
jgi:hypothetical protein